jgi:hypothetical protein
MTKMTKLIKLSVILVAGLLSACNTLDKVKDVNLWPFGNSVDAPRIYRPANSTEYACEKGKKFYIRVLDNGANVWLMLSDREVLLPKVGNEKVYSNGISRLDMTGAEVSLEASPENRYIGCKVVPINNK